MNTHHATSSEPDETTSAPGYTRRRFVAGAAASGVGTAIAAAPWRVGDAGVAPGSVSQRQGRLVVVFLRGAADHLSVTVPLDDPDYLRLRPGIAVDPSRTLELDGRFGLHPALGRLHERYRAGQLAPLVTVGNPAGDRSHFVSQDLYERGSDGGGDVDDGGGWLARHLATDDGSDEPLRAVTVGSSVDASLLGYGAVGLRSISSFGVAGLGDDAAALDAALRVAYRGDAPLDAAAHRALDAAAAVSELRPSQQRDPELAAFDDIATLLAADLGTEVITTSLDGWDQHTRMGDVDGGDMTDQLAKLDTTVGGLLDAFDEHEVDDTTVLVVTEFGRRVAENGSGGCDHGWGSVALAIGPDVLGGRVHGEWLGLDADVLGEYRGDVPALTDFRDLLGDAVEHVLDGDVDATFRGHIHRPTGVFVRS